MMYYKAAMWLIIEVVGKRPELLKIASLNSLLICKKQIEDTASIFF